MGEHAREGVGGKYRTRSTSAIPWMAVPFSKDPLFINSVYCDAEDEKENDKLKSVKMVSCGVK